LNQVRSFKRTTLSCQNLIVTRELILIDALIFSGPSWYNVIPGRVFLRKIGMELDFNDEMDGQHSAQENILFSGMNQAQ
jgi:hypothetical protein